MVFRFSWWLCLLLSMGSLAIFSMSCFACFTAFSWPLMMNDVSRLVSILAISTWVLFLILSMLVPFLPMILPALILSVLKISETVSVGCVVLGVGSWCSAGSLFTVTVTDVSVFVACLSGYLLMFLHFSMISGPRMMQALSVRWIPSCAIMLLSVSRGSMLMVSCFSASL